MKLPTLFSLCLLILYTCSRTLGSMFLTDRELRHMKGKFCGPNLSDMLSVVCHGKYNSPRMQKKSGEFFEKKQSNIIEAFLIVIEEESDMYPFLSRNSAFNFLTDGVSKRGIVDECCLKSCSLVELQSYCR